MEPSTIIGIISLIVGAASAGLSYQNSQAQRSANKVKMDMDAMQAYRSGMFQNAAMWNEHRQFTMEMGFKGRQLAYQSEAFNQDMYFKQQMLEYELSQHEAQLQFEHLQQMADIDFAGKSMKAAHDASIIDMELLDQEWTEITSEASLDTFERKRQALKEQAQIRVSQGESGIFGNTALKELANSVMQQSWDTGIIGWNLKNKGKQQEAKIKKVAATEVSRTNEALASVPKHVQGQMSGAYAGLTI